MIRFFDASALVKRYVIEDGTDAVRRLLAEGSPVISRLSAVEVASALARRCREGILPPEERDRSLAQLWKDLPKLLVVELVPAVTETARDLLVRHTLRAADSIQLASALFLRQQLGQAPELIAYDDRLRQAARAEELTITG